MGAQHRVFRRRISAVQSTKKITKAMELIAASRIVKAQQRVAESTPYAEAITETVTHRREQLVDRARAHDGAGEPRPGGRAGHHQRPRSGRRLQRNALRAAEQLTVRLREEGKEPVPYVVGRKGVAFYRFRNREMARAAGPGSPSSRSTTNAKEVADTLIDAFLRRVRRRRRRRDPPRLHRVRHRR